MKKSLHKAWRWVQRKFGSPPTELEVLELTREYLKERNRFICFALDEAAVTLSKKHGEKVSHVLRQEVSDRIHLYGTASAYWVDTNSMLTDLPYHYRMHCIQTFRINILDEMILKRTTFKK